MKHLLTGLWLQTQQQSKLTRLFLFVYFSGLVVSIKLGSVLLLLINVVGATAMMVSSVRLTYRREATFLTPGMRQAEISATLFTCSLLTWMPLLIHVTLNGAGFEVIAGGFLLVGTLLVATAFSELIVAALMFATLPLLWMKAVFPDMTVQLFTVVFLPAENLAVAYVLFGLIAYAVFAWRIRVGEEFRPPESGGGLEQEVMLLDRFAHPHPVHTGTARLRAVLRGSAPAAYMEWLIFAYTFIFALLFALDFSWNRGNTMGTELALCFVFYLVTLFAWTRDLPVDQLWLMGGFTSRRRAAFALAADQMYRDTRLLLPALAVIAVVCLIPEEPYAGLPLRLAASVLLGATIKLLGNFTLWLLGLFAVLVLGGTVEPAWFATGCTAAWLGALAVFANRAEQHMPQLAAE